MNFLFPLICRYSIAKLMPSCVRLGNFDMAWETFLKIYIHELDVRNFSSGYQVFSPIEGERTLETR